MRDRFRHNIDDPDSEHMRAAAGLLNDCLFQLAAERENLIGVAQHQPTDLGQFQVATDP